MSASGNSWKDYEFFTTQPENGNPAGPPVPEASRDGGGSIVSTVLGVGSMLGVVGAVTAMSVYKKCPPNKLLVVYGRGAGRVLPTAAGNKLGGGMRIVRNGGASVFPPFQGSAYLSLEPMAMDISLKGALSLEKIRINAPSQFTVAISTEEETAINAAQRLLYLERDEIQMQAQEVILGQMRQVLAALSIDEINRDREKFVCEVEKHCETELGKLGLTLLNTNVQNITDDSGVIDALGQKAAATAKQQALVDVATQEKSGAIGVSEQNKAKDISVSDNIKERKIGIREAEREANTRIEQLEAEEMIDVNMAKQKKSESEALLATAKAGYERQAMIAQEEAQAAIAEARSRAQTQAALAYADQVEAQTRAKLESVAKAEKAKRLVNAEAKAEEIRIVAQAEADAQCLIAAARSRGDAAGLIKKAEGLKAIVDSCGGSENAYRMLLLEHLDTLAESSAAAISNIKFDKVVVWDGGNKPDGNSGGTIPNFIKDVTTSLPPTLDVLSDIVGVDLRPTFGDKVKDVGASQVMKKSIETTTTNPPDASPRE